MLLLPKARVPELAAALAKNYHVYAPVLEGKSQQVMFSRVEQVSEIRLDAALPAVPPKHVVFPQFKKVLQYRYDREKQKVELAALHDESSKALFGLRPCDLTGLQCLDRFYLGQAFVDEVYRSFRRRMFIVTNTCVSPFRDCLCACMDSGPAAKEGYDLNLTEINGEYLVEIGSERGRALAEGLSLAPAGDAHQRAKEATINRSLSLFDKVAVENKAWISRVVNRVTTGLFDEKVWSFIGDQCLECGACSFVCPSCSCFNTVEAPRAPGTADRLRTWDSCSFEGYSRMAGGHNPRKPVEDRRSKRFFCKLSYSQSKKYLRPGCVGCGRCAWVCPGDIGMPNVVTYIRREIEKGEGGSHG